VRADAQGCLNYHSSVVLTGRLERRTFPGPPNYQDIRAGDTAETGYYLSLDSSVCTVGESDSADGYPVRDARLVQLVLNSSEYQRLQRSVGKKITVKGGLFAAFTGHHHAPLLLTMVEVLSGEDGVLKPDPPERR
jgi:hypothetical protein